MCFIVIISIICEFLLNQLFNEFVPRLDIICIIIFNVLNPLMLFMLGLIKDTINVQILGFSSLLYCLLFVLHYHCKLRPTLSFTVIFLIQWVVDTIMFSEYQQPLKDFIANYAITLIAFQGLCFKFRVAS
ncbi:hypothetical protein BIY23_02305 [Wolbachia pipientis]|uniref:Uncharacterized protein n=2 Tax=Wolbachia pipientis TaxID=955 RepID=A0A1E7QJN3_WOLPI|nr:hypothetical protein BIY23_02305 [Wolbachia pipientis]